MPDPNSQPPVPQPPNDEPSSAQPGETDAFYETVVRYLDDALDARELEAFNRALAEDPGKRELLMRAGMIQSSASEVLMTEEAMKRKSLIMAGITDAALDKEVAIAASERPSFLRKARWRRSAWAVAASLALATLIGAFFWSRRPTIETYATATAVSQAQWRVGPEPDGRLPLHHELSLTRGWTEIEFKSGVRLVIEGPATFTVDSPTSLDLAHGRLSAHVPGGGFAVSTPDARITDLGTEFSVSVMESTSVAVFSGKISVATRGRQGAGGGGRRVRDKRTR